ncbi:YbaB/EbfC family nucleoid-associated protein [Mycobacterium lepromatosis]|uniref:ESX-1 secretion-associated protein EspL n=1 Tax=Mycobacterium lepromatosis TaxID=480418 RepID=A0A0F4ESU9_9MYCO|nr:YbaB/EbfC family nucleoid-associated protein [Mycobacterium lepromatosis]KJX75909.1 ESX-1 secretion-associated protein EspL [Mycobacterium lepromatosis]UKN41449.1 DNA-binding protein [Mycobacterium lepromatosis]
MDLDPMQAQIIALLGQFQSALDGQCNQMNDGVFKASDQEKTVEVTINGYQWLTDIHIESGALREFGHEVVADRINAALQNAQSAATAYNEAAREQLAARLSALSRPISEPPPT